MFDKKNIKKIIAVDEQARTPKYRQIIQRVIDAINAKQLAKGDLLPSINEVCRDCALSRDTVVKAYDHLKKLGILTPVHGKGFYVQCNQYQGEKRVFVLFDELETPYKNALYSALKTGVADRAHLDIYFHHYNPVEFERLVTMAQGQYEYYVVMTFDHDCIRKALPEIDQDKLLVLDQFNEFPGCACAVIRQN